MYQGGFAPLFDGTTAQKCWSSTLKLTVVRVYTPCTEAIALITALSGLTTGHDPLHPRSLFSCHTNGRQNLKEFNPKYDFIENKKNI